MKFSIFAASAAIVASVSAAPVAVSPEVTNKQTAHIFTA